MSRTIVNRIFYRLHVFRRNEQGVTAIEYGILIAMISGVLLIALPSIGQNISNPMNDLVSAINNGGATSGDDGEGDSESDDSEHASNDSGDGGDDDDDHEDDDDDDHGHG